ncbi:hypothetical protein EBR37_03720 [bacterium]|jgi:diadenosine tetraphosphate (Ap4A) HIT family hydrolase|nr:hypothetical protein [bacterium]
MNHYRKTFKKYKARKNDSSCPFCDENTYSRIIVENKYSYIVPNQTKYDLWELHDVQDHLLLIPKRHVESLKQLDKNEKIEIIEQIAIYEEKGYSVYARGVGFIRRSVKHQHTHLIKSSNKEAKIALFIDKPYLLLKK